MKNNYHIYVDSLKEEVYSIITKEINDKKVKHIVYSDLKKTYLTNSKTSKFHKYYFSILQNESNFLKNSSFFKEFKSKYSLQGVDGKFLRKIESNKIEILKNIKTQNISELYFNNFHKVSITHGDKLIVKNLGSFFTKLVHTFKPNEYCPLDNPIKNFFKLKNESFFISFLVISETYLKWSEDNRLILDNIRIKFKELDKNGVFDHDRITDLRLLDLIFWSKSNNK